MWAAGGHLPDIVDLLLAKGANTQVNLRAKADDWDRTQTSEPRAQFSSRQTGGLTALLYATRSGCLRCAQSLVEAGADINKPNPDGVTPLLNAADNSRLDVVMFLLDKGANPHVGTCTAAPRCGSPWTARRRRWWWRLRRRWSRWRRRGGPGAGRGAGRGGNPGAGSRCHWRPGRPGGPRALAALAARGGAGARSAQVRQSLRCRSSTG